MMATRPVEAFRGAWSALDEPLSDAGVALDVLSTFDPKYGPTVVRVRATGGTTAARHSVAGDWLCDRDAANGRTTRFERDSAWRVAVLGEAVPPGAVSRGWSALDLWETDDLPQLMLEAALSVPMPRVSLLRASWACAKAAMDSLVERDREEAAIETLALVMRWTRGEATVAQVRAVAGGAYARRPGDQSAYAHRSVVDAALAIPERGAELDGNHLVMAMSHALISLWHKPGSSRSWSNARAACAVAVRSQVNTVEFLRACRAKARSFAAGG